MTKVTIRAAKVNLFRLIARAEAGEEIVLMRGKTPVARLTAFAPVRPKRKFGALKGRIALDARFFEPLPETELSGWE